MGDGEGVWQGLERWGEGGGRGWKRGENDGEGGGEWGKGGGDSGRGEDTERRRVGEGEENVSEWVHLRPP